MGVVDVLRTIQDHVPNPLDPLGTLFGVVVDTNIATSSTIAVPTSYTRAMLDYARANPLDGALLLVGLGRNPVYHSGGWILSVQTGAAAMTLDRHIFAKAPLSIGTYVHEMVHVGQYGVTGRTGFLVSYFGLSAMTIAKRLIARENLDVMQSSPHEDQAYNLERRFLSWRASA